MNITQPAVPVLPGKEECPGVKLTIDSELVGIKQRLGGTILNFNRSVNFKFWQKKKKRKMNNTSLSFFQPAFFLVYFTCSLWISLFSLSRDPLRYRYPFSDAISMMPAFSPDSLKLTAGSSIVNQRGKEKSQGVNVPFQEYFREFN